MGKRFFLNLNLIVDIYISWKLCPSIVSVICNTSCSSLILPYSLPAFSDKWWYVIRIKLKHHKQLVCEIMAISRHLCSCTTSKLVVELIVVKVAILAWTRSLNCIHVQQNCISSRFKLHYVRCAISLFLFFNSMLVRTWGRNTRPKGLDLALKFVRLELKLFLQFWGQPHRHLLLWPVLWSVMNL